MSRIWKKRLDQLQKLTRVNLTTTPIALSELRHGDRQEVRLNLAVQALTLPFATGKGGMYRLFVETTVTNLTIAVASGNNPKTGAADVFYGVASITGTAAGTFAATAAALLSMTGTTKGGLKGSYVEIEDADVGIWRIEANLLGSGTAITPFS